jgi:ATP-dependent helicase/DNAse subunit B
MVKDKFKALWVSHSSLSDFLKCPRSYYLKNIYKNPETKRKVVVTSPFLSLGSAVHNVLERLAEIPVADRPNTDLIAIFENEWKRYTGEIGGFSSAEQELAFKERGISMLDNVKTNLEPLTLETVSMGEELPYVWLSADQNIILCGKVDWISRQDDGIHIIDFKTGKNEESEDSLQLPIYAFLAKSILKEKNIKISYWYIDSSAQPVSMKIPDLKEAYEKVLKISLEIKAAKESNDLKCKRGGCFACRDLEKVLTGEAKYVGVGDYNKDIFYVEN